MLTIRLARRSSDISGRFATVLQPLNEYRMKNRRGRGYESAHLLIDYCRQRIVNQSEQPVGLWGDAVHLKVVCSKNRCSNNSKRTGTVESKQTNEQMRAGPSLPCRDFSCERVGPNQLKMLRLYRAIQYCPQNWYRKLYQWTTGAKVPR